MMADRGGIPAQVRVLEHLAIMMPIRYEQYNPPYLGEVRLRPKTSMLNNLVAVGIMM